MMSFKSTLLTVVALAIALPVSAGSMAALAEKTDAGSRKLAKSAKTPSPTSDESAIRDRIAALATAAASGDVAKMASLWLPDGSYVDEDGTQTRSRQSIQERFAAVRDGNRKVNIAVNPTLIKLLGADAAWVEGTVSRQTSLSMEPSTRFTMLLQKNDGNWMISSATETAITNKSAADHLGMLDWLIGEWSSQHGDGKVKMTAEWTANKAFILCKFRLEPPQGGAKLDSQVIGWDPTREQIVSWHFDSNGSFGYGSWSKRGKQWIVHAEGVEQSGSRTNATNLMSMEDRNKFSWQSVGRTIDGVPVGDTQPLVVQRATN